MRLNVMGTKTLAITTGFLLAATMAFARPARPAR